MPAPNLVQPILAKRHDGRATAGDRPDDISARTTPESGDVVVRKEMREGRFVYFLHTALGTDQYQLPTREEAVAQAVAFAKRQGVHAWSSDGTGNFVLLNDVRVAESV